MSIMDSLHTEKKGLTSLLADKLSKSADTYDRGGLTKAGRALQKHGDRLGSSFFQVKGNPTDINVQAIDIVNNILNNPDSRVIQRHHPRFGDIVDIKSPDGQGIRYDAYDNFIGFLEP